MITLPLAVRLRRAALIALILGLWGPFKVVWEVQIAREQNFLRYGGTPFSLHLREQLGQGLTFGVLSGMGSVVADCVWLGTEPDWEKKQWFAIMAHINLCTTLQPRSMTFWSIGGWQLAWNASAYELRDSTEKNDLKRLKASQFWIQKGLDLYLRGMRNIPERYRLWADTGMLYQMRLAQQEARLQQPAASARDYHTAAYYYAEAVKRPDCPIFYERLPALMYGEAGDDQAAYGAWRELWFRLTPKQRTEMQHIPTPADLTKIRNLETRLSIPPEKRVFPN